MTDADRIADDERNKDAAFWKQVNLQRLATPSHDIACRAIVQLKQALAAKEAVIAQVELDKVLAQAVAAELSFALGVAYTACKENGATITEELERTIVAALNNECGKALLSQRDTLHTALQKLINAVDDSHPEDLPAEIFAAARKAQAALHHAGGEHE